MNIDEKKIVELIKALWAKNPIATIVIGLLEAAAIAVALWLFASCTSNLFVQKGNTGSTISSSTSPSVTSSVDSTKIILPTK